MKILLGSSRVAMKLLLKILLQCCLPVDGSSAGRAGSAQAARADGVGRAGAQRRAPTRVRAPTAGGEAAPPPQVRTPPGSGSGCAGDAEGGEKRTLGIACEEGESVRGGMRGWRGCAHRRGAPAQSLCPPAPLCLFFIFFFPMFIWSIPRFKKKPKKIPNYREKKINANPHYRLGASFPIDSSCPPAPVRVWAAGGDERVGTRHRE